MPRTPITNPDDVPVLFSPRDKENKVKCTKAEMEMRRIEVARRRLCGQSISIIAEGLGYSEATIKNDIDAVQESNIQVIKNFDQAEFVCESLEVFKRVEQEAFTQLYEVPDGDMRKSKFLKDIRDSRKASIDLLQDSGLVRTEPKKIDVAVSVDVLNSWSSEQRTMVSSAILDAAIIGEVEEEHVPFDPYADAKKKAQELDLEDIAEFSDDTE